VKMITVGSVAYDSLETPFGVVKRAPGGSAVHASLAARFFVKKPGLVGVVGSDYRKEDLRLLNNMGIETSGLSRQPGKTFHWKGRYVGDMGVAQTLKTDLGVFSSFQPRLSSEYRRAEFLFLANIDPELQIKVLEQVERPQFTLLDTMNLWISIKKKALQRAIARVDAVVLNEQEVLQLSGKASIADAARSILGLGPKILVIKRGGNGASLYNRNEFFSLPAFPVKKVKDPTGAGDSFAGGFIGYLALKGNLERNTLRRAMAFGTVLASFNVEDFAIRRVSGLKMREIKSRFNSLRQITQF
jgi:sugar/nucleoside kinase (ribokinase family)